MARGINYREGGGELTGVLCLYAVIRDGVHTKTI